MTAEQESPIFFKFIVISLMIFAAVIYFNYQDGVRYNQFFEEVEGTPTSAVAVTNYYVVPFVNTVDYARFRREELKSEEMRRALDGIMKRVWENKIVVINDTLPEVSYEVWKRYANYFDDKTIKIDTFLLRAYRDTLHITIQQRANISVDYRFGIENSWYYAALPVMGKDTITVESDTATTFEIKTIYASANYLSPMRFEDFKPHTEEIDAMLSGHTQLKFVFERVENSITRQTGYRNLYFIKTKDVKVIYENEDSLTALVWKEGVLSWKENFLHLFFIGSMLLIWFYVGMKSLIAYYKQKRLNQTD
jgi:hypothetical protein